MDARVDQGNWLDKPQGGNPGWPPAVIAIPANNEADRIGACLAALAMQRDGFGAPLPAGAFEVLVLANNCTDDTAAVTRRWAAESPHPVTLVEDVLPAGQANAGGARRLAMDLAAERLERIGSGIGIIMTTDADSTVAPTWVSATMAAFARGVDAVAGYIDAHPPELVGLGAGFLRRSRLEDRYLSAIAEIEALCDPLAHDPWPNHRVSSGASLAVTLAAYRAIGGLPPKPLGEDIALCEVLAEAGFRIRHAMDVCVSTSCRLEGRAPGGAADTIRHRHQVVEAPCDGDMVPARDVLWRSALKGRLRRASGDAMQSRAVLARALGAPAAERLAEGAGQSFAGLWREMMRASPRLSRPATLRPSDLPDQIFRAEVILRRLRATVGAGDRADRFDRADARARIPS